MLSFSLDFRAFFWFYEVSEGSLVWGVSKCLLTDFRGRWARGGKTPFFDTQNLPANRFNQEILKMPRHSEKSRKIGNQLPFLPEA